MNSHNYILKIIEETLLELLKTVDHPKQENYKDVLRDYIFNLVSDKYSNETVYARTQSIDLQLKADVIRELRPAMEKIKEQFL